MMSRHIHWWWWWFLVFNGTVSNISAISWIAT